MYYHNCNSILIYFFLASSRSKLRLFGLQSTKIGFKLLNKIPLAEETNVKLFTKIFFPFLKLNEDIAKCKAAEPEFVAIAFFDLIKFLNSFSNLITSGP